MLTASPGVALLPLLLNSNGNSNNEADSHETSGLCFTWCLRAFIDEALGVASLRLAASLSHVNAIEDFHRTGNGGQSLNASLDGLRESRSAAAFPVWRHCGSVGFDEDNKSLFG